MTTTINEAKEVTLVDGTKITVRPLKISLLRQFLKKFDEVAAVADDNDKSMDILIQCVQIAMRQYNPEIADDLAALEDNLDLPTVYKVIEEASGINLSETSPISTLK
jgi:hypothetical protein